MSGIATTIRLVDNMTAPIMSIQHAISGLENHMNALANSGVDISSLTAMNNQIAAIDATARMVNDDMQLIADSVNEATGNQNRFNAGLRQGRSASDGLLSNITRMAAAYLSLRGVKNFMDFSDNLSGARARLGLINDGLQTTAQLQNNIYSAAQRAKVPYTEMLNSVSKLGLLAGKAFSSNKETIRFSELMSKNFAVAGASAQESSAAMYQLNQALASGRLQGDEYRSTIENAPLLAQSIEAYMRDAGVEGTLKEWASEGLLTAEVIKGALFSSADEIERRFASMPMTFAQVGNAAANALLKAFDPAIQAFGRSAQYIYENWDRLAPLIYGAAAAVAAYVLAANAANIANAIAIIRSGLMSLALAAQAVGYFVLAAATGSAAASMAALNALMMANPILLIVAAIGLIVYLIVRWIQKVGGLRIAWLIMQDAILSALANLKIFGMEVWDALIGKIQGFISETLVDFQNWYNIVAGLLNKLIEGINTVSGLSIPTLPTATFGDKVSQDFERNNRMREYNIANEKRQASLDRIDRQNAIVEAQTSTAQGDEDVVQNVERIANNTAAALDYSEEEIKLWRDIAERDTINRFTTAEVSVSFGDVNNNVSSGVDLDGIIDYIAEKTEEALLVTAAGVHYDGV